MGEDAGKWISRVSHQLKRQMSYEEDAEEERELTNMQKHILHFILLEGLNRDLFQRDLEKELQLRSKLLKNIRRREAQIREGIPADDMEVFIRVLKQISENLSSGERAKENDMIYRKEESDE